jgi:hypothetical protein
MKSNTCTYIGCLKDPSFNVKGSKKGIFCEKHKERNMVNVNTKSICEHESCQEGAWYNSPEIKQPKFCKRHKEPHHIYVYKRPCLEEGCNTYPCYSYPDQKKSYCSAHQKPGMVNVTQKICTYPECLKRATHGLIGISYDRCGEHKLINMVWEPNRRCENAKCKELALFGVSQRLHCETHKLEFEQRLYYEKCVSCDLNSIIDKNGRCENCCPEAFRSQYLFKQRSIQGFLEASGICFKQVDKMIEHGKFSSLIDIYRNSDHFIYSSTTKEHVAKNDRIYSLKL